MGAVMMDRGIPSSVDPNVTVYPLFADEPVMRRETLPALRPPSSEFMPMESPFGGPLQTPAPLLQPPIRQPQGFLQPPAPQSPNFVPASGASRVYFKHGSSRLNESGKQVVDFVGRNAGGKIVVEGHASERAETNDPVERSIVNLKMSMDRAFQVSSELIRDGVPIQQIETRAFGHAQPGAHTTGVAGEAAHRRVEIKTGLMPSQTYDRSAAYAPRLPVPQAPAPIPPLADY